MRKVILVVENVRSSHNVGSLLRTADGLGVSQVYLTGYTPHPPYPGDNKLPHEKNRAQAQIHKTALGAEKTVDWSYSPDIAKVLRKLSSEGYYLLALEQSDGSTMLHNYQPPGKIALVVGNELSGVSSETIDICDDVIEIPMVGAKESLNVAIATAIAIYYLKSPK